MATAEAAWAIGGAVALVAFGLLPIADAWTGVAKGADIYLFLAGIMLIAELARSEGLFEWLAGIAASHARGSAKRLFALIYIVGIVVTGVSFERRHGRRTDAGRVCRCERGTHRAPALSLNLRVHRQCRELRAADF